MMKKTIIILLLLLGLALSTVVLAQIAIDDKELLCKDGEISITEGKLTKCVPVKEPTMIGNSIKVYGRVIINTVDQDIEEFPKPCCYLSDVTLSKNNPPVCECVYYEK